MDSDHSLGQRPGLVDIADESEDGSFYQTVDESQHSSPEPQSPLGASKKTSSSPTPPTAEKMSPLKRPAEPDIITTPFKRQRRAFNGAYMDLLNGDIEDAANSLVLEKQQSLRQSKVGLTTWTSLEKEIFFESLSRLGRDDLPGIAKRIRTKNQIEVHQYIKLLDGALHDLRKDKYQIRWEDILDMSDYPAAKELSQECCAALEEAADDLSLRMERHETRVEEKKWGDLWSIDVNRAKVLEKEAELTSQHQLNFAELFRISNWLEVSSRIFMNSADPDNNWISIQDEPPCVRATAMADFHNLVVSITRKLVISSLQVAQSRIKAKRAIKPNTRDIIKVRDVEAAAASLSMKLNSRQFWTKCARRLQLHVYEGDIPVFETAEEELDEGLMSYDEVERQLMPEDSTDQQQTHQTPEQPTTTSRIMPLIDFELPSSPGSDSDDSPLNSPRMSSSPPLFPGIKQEQEEMAQEDLEVREEVKEALVYSAHELSQTKRVREAVESRIRLEREQEAHADSVDACASFDEEMGMWKTLGRLPPEESQAKPEKNKRSSKMTTGLRELLIYGDRWRENIQYAGEWEVFGQAKLSGFDE